MRRTTRGGRRLLVAAAALTLGLGAAASWGQSVRAQTASAVVQAEGDAYSVYGEASVLGGGPIHVGPLTPTEAYVPPSTAPHTSASVINCKSAGPAVCVDPLLDGLNVLQSNADAGLTPTKTNCDGAPPGFGGDSIVGGNACETIASVAALNSGTPTAPMDNLFASAITVESQMQGCDYGKNAVGKMEIANLTIGGQEVIGPDPGSILGDVLTPAPNTVISIGALTVILNEEHYDNQGHGFIVNAIHVFTSDDLGALANVDLVIGHAHAEDMCASGTVTAPPSNPGSTGQNLPVGSKLDNTKSADPGEVVTYTLTITSNSCEVTSVTDMLPPGFTFIPGSESGDLNVTPVPGPGNSIEFYNAGGFLKAKLVETFKAKISDTEAHGDYVNSVAGDSSPAASDATSACGAFEFSDTLPVNGPIAANNGNNPGIIVPRSGTPTPTAVPTAAPTQSVQAVTTPAAVSTPNTAAGSPAAWGTPLGLALLGGAVLLRRRRRGRLS